MYVYILQRLWGAGPSGLSSDGRKRKKKKKEKKKKPSTQDLIHLLFRPLGSLISSALKGRKSLVRIPELLPPSLSAKCNYFVVGLAKGDSRAYLFKYPTKYTTLHYEVHTFIHAYIHSRVGMLPKIRILCPALYTYPMWRGKGLIPCPPRSDCRARKRACFASVVRDISVFLCAVRTSSRYPSRSGTQRLPAK